MLLYAPIFVIRGKTLLAIKLFRGKKINIRKMEFCFLKNLFLKKKKKKTKQNKHVCLGFPYINAPPPRPAPPRPPGFILQISWWR